MDNYYTEIVRSRRGTSNVAETEPSQGLDLWLLGRGLRIGNIFSLAFPLSAPAKHYAVFTTANKLDLTHYHNWCFLPPMSMAHSYFPVLSRKLLMAISNICRLFE